MATHLSPLSDQSHVVRERRFSTQSELDRIVQQLRDAHATGTLSVHFSQGGVGDITFQERQRIQGQDK
jgi:hypothetical protein